MLSRATLAALVSATVTLAAASARADHLQHGPTQWGLQYRRACRSYAPAGDPVFDTRGRTLTWCQGRFSVADGRYEGAVSFNLDAPHSVMANGRELLARETAPDHWEIVVRHDHGRHFEHLAPALNDLRTVALSVRGESAVVTRADGHRAVLALPTGRTVLPLAADGHELRSALAPDGTVLALAGPSSVVLYALSGAAPQRLAVLHEHRAAVAFTDDGRTLLVARGDGTLLSAFHAGTHDAPAPERPVNFTVGNGVTSVDNADGWLPRLDASRTVPLAPRAEHGLVTAWRRLYGAHAGVSDARVFATDASEFATYAGRTSGWARAVMERYADGGWDPTSLHVWHTTGAHPARAAEWRTRRTPNTGWTTVRVQEVGGTLYRVEVDTAQGSAHSERDALLNDVITTPFGAVR